MPLTFEEFVQVFLRPLVIVSVWLGLFRWGRDRENGLRLAPALAFTLGTAFGIWRLHVIPWAPTSHWHWLLPLLLASPAVGPITRAPGVSAIERWLLTVAFAAVSGWWLVPDFESMPLPQPQMLLVWIVSFSVLSILLEGICDRTSPVILGTSLFIAGLLGAVVQLFAGEISFAKIALAGAGSSAGLAIGGRLVGTDFRLKGIAPGVLLLLGGDMLIGQTRTYSDVPAIAFVLIVLAPFSLGLFARGPLHHMADGKRKVFLQLVLPLSIAATAVILAAIYQPLEM